ncbi:hypothetical protein OG241_15775 [Streptomyces sp. NBC_01390]|uniref:hypothetical protein n=1 Tax=Streptomyces sp. NBC_01390 TaxID=2903850 RepID=UPI00324E056F
MNDPYAMPDGVLRDKLAVIADHQLPAATEADITLGASRHASGTDFRTSPVRY